MGYNQNALVTRATYSSDASQNPSAQSMTTEQLLNKAIKESDEQARLAEDAKRMSLAIALKNQAQNEINRPIANLVDMMTPKDAQRASAGIPGQEVDAQKVATASFIPGGDYLKGALAKSKLEQDKAEIAFKNAMKNSMGDKSTLIKLSKEYKSDKSTKDLKDKVMAVNNVDAIVFSDLLQNPVAINMAKRMLVRASGDPRPSDKDVEAFGNIPSLKNRIDAVATKLDKGELLTAEDKDAWKELVTIQKRKTLEQFNQHNQAWKELGTTAFGVDPLITDKIIDQAAGYSTKAATQAVGTPNSQPNVSPERLKMQQDIMNAIRGGK